MKNSYRRLTYTGLGDYDHVYSDAGDIPLAEDVKKGLCPCCNGQLVDFSTKLGNECEIINQICLLCGWWHLKRYISVITEEGESIKAQWWQLHHALYSDINLSSNEISIESLRQHLLRSWKDRKYISAQKAEDLIGGILEEYYGGSAVKSTANTNTPDGGIDLYIVHDGNNIKRAIQVKRRVNKEVESIEEVRNFIGAMILDGSKKGTYVTTASRFSKKAVEIIGNKNLKKYNLSLDMIDGERLYEILEHSNRNKPIALPDFAVTKELWEGPNGIKVTTEQLFLTDISRIV